MKTRRIAKWSFVIISTFMTSFYVENYFATEELEETTVLASNTETRLQHARELLGSRFRGSLVEKSAQGSVSKFVYTTVQRKLLDKKWADQAPAVSAMILSESYKNGFDPLFVLAVIQTESGFDPSIIGSVGEIGLMQVKPDTGRWIAQKESIPWKGTKTLKNPILNVKIGVAYMAFLRKNFGGAAGRYVAAYNMGPRNVRRLIAKSVQPRDYPTRVMTNYKSMYSEFMKVGHLAEL